MQKTAKKTVVGITGATATGKTGVSIQVAKHFECPIVSFDSRQFYKELLISSAAPTAQEMEGIPHYFISSLSIKSPLNAAQYARAAHKLMQNLLEEYDVIVMVGGSGLYLSAFLTALNPLPGAHRAIRKNLNHIFNTKGVHILSEMLRCYDPDYYLKVDRQNPHRLIRALEVSMQSGVPYSELIKPSEGGSRHFDFIGIHLTEVKEALSRRIALRTDKMLRDGLISEVKFLNEMNLDPPLQSIGFNEIIPHLKGEITLEEAKNRLNINTLAYAKRQMTWFRKKGYPEFHRSQKEAIMKFISSRMNTQY